MNKEEQLINELSKMPPMVIATAYLHAINYVEYGVDVTEKWVTAIQQASALEKAYQKGYYNALQEVKKEIEQEYDNVKNDYHKGRNIGLWIATQITEANKMKNDK